MAQSSLELEDVQKNLDYWVDDTPLALLTNIRIMAYCYNLFTREDLTAKSLDGCHRVRIT